MKHFKNSIYISLLILLSINLAHARSIEQIIESKKKATLLITVREKNLKYKEIGTGFFTDNKGHFVTNYHVLESYLNKPKDFLVQFQTSDGEEFSDVEIEKCSNNNKIDLCYGKIETSKKIYFFDVLNRSPVRSQMISLIGHSNEDYFASKSGEVFSLDSNVEEKTGTSFEDRENRNTSMVEIGKYVCKNGSCNGDSGGPVFDPFTGDLLGVFCNGIGKKNQEKKLYAIDTKEVYAFINSDSKFIKFKIPNEHFHFKPIKVSADVQKKVMPGKGDEFEFERRTGQLEK